MFQGQIGCVSEVLSIFLSTSKKYTKAEALTYILLKLEDNQGAFDREFLSQTFGWTDLILTRFLDDLVLTRCFSVYYEGKLIKVVAHPDSEVQTRHLKAGKTKKVPYEIGKTYLGTPDRSLLPKEARLVLLDEGQFSVQAEPYITVPFPEDPTLNVRMRAQDWERLCREWGEEEAVYLACQLQDYSISNPKRFKKYKDHARTLEVWRRLKVENNYEFDPHHKNGAGYYRATYRRNGAYGA